jgi:RNA polymerase sigma-70 factor (ECF subfamily)
MSFAYLQLGSDADTEDAVDATFDSVMDKWHQMLEMEHLEAYAWAILKNRIKDQQRKRQRRPEPMDIAAFEAALRDISDDPYDGLVDAITLYSAARRLSERQRDLIVLCYGLGYTSVEAAALLGLEEATVRSHLCQARRRLARLLQADYSNRADEGEKTT